MIYHAVELYNVHELLDSDEGAGSAFCRIPNDLRLTLNDSAKANALQTPGCEVRFNLTGDRAAVTLRSTQQPSIAEVYQGEFLIAVHPVDVTPTTLTIERPPSLELLARQTREHHLVFDADLTRVVLPYRPPCRLIGIEGDVAPPRPDQTPPTKYLAYGSSITHGSTAVRPTGSYAMRTAQRLGVDLLNLGFGGGAHLEREMADHIAGRDDWDVATLELGINLIRGIDPPEFARRVEYFIPTIARAHPDRWIFCIDVFSCVFDYDGSGKAEAFREIVRTQVEGLNMSKLVHVSGKDILPSVHGLTGDLVHPAPAGMEEMAANLAKKMREAGFRSNR